MQPRGSTTDTYQSFSSQCKDQQLIHFRPSNRFRTVSIMFSSFPVTSKEHLKKINLPSPSLTAKMIWSGLTAKLIWHGLTAFSFQATVSATHLLHRHCHQERQWYLCIRFHDTVHMWENSLVHAYGSCTLQRHSQLHSCRGSSWARTLEQPVDQWSQESPGYH